ncbi:MAG: hypothetical protein U0798_05850 [Gemmataceae bacterium]
MDAFEATGDANGTVGGQGTGRVLARYPVKAGQVSINGSIILDEAVEGCRQAHVSADCTDPLVRYAFRWLGVDGMTSKASPRKSPCLSMRFSKEKYPVC